MKQLLKLIDQAAKSQLAESELVNVKEALELLKDIVKLQQNNDDNDNENALVDNMGEMAKGEEDGASDEEDQARLSMMLPPMNPFVPGHWFRRG